MGFKVSKIPQLHGGDFSVERCERHGLCLLNSSRSVSAKKKWFEAGN